jgi:hypothetical protein
MLCHFGFWILRLKSRGGSLRMCFSQDGFWIGKALLSAESANLSVTFIFEIGITPR